MELRPYQIKAIEDIFSVFKKADSVMLQMPTGTGKTVVFTSFVKRWLLDFERNKRILFIVHRTELVDQIIQHLNQSGIHQVNRIQGKVRHEDLVNVQVHVGTVQTLRNLSNLPKNLSLIVIDEAHHTPAASYEKILEAYSKFKGLKVLGVTATPQRLSGEGFSRFFNELILSDPIKKFQEDGFLARTRHFVTSVPELAHLKLRNGDYLEKESEQLMMSEQVMADLIESYEKYALGKKVIVFAAGVEHSKKIVERYNAIGIKAAHIDGSTKSELRSNLVEKFKKGEITVLSNVNIFTEGFDCPDVEVVQLARPTKSLVLYLQMVGRVMRPALNKDHGLILDNARLWQEHGLSNQRFEWNWEGNSINPLKQLLNIKRPDETDGKGIKLLQEIKGLELIEVSESEHSLTFKHEVHIEREVSASLVDAMSLRERQVQCKNNLINYGRGVSSSNFSFFDDAISVRYNQSITIRKCLEIKSYGRMNNTIRKVDIDEATFEKILVTLISSFAKMNYTYAHSKKKLVSLKHDIALNINQLEIKILEIPNHYFLIQENYRKIKQLQSSLANVDFNVGKVRFPNDVLKEIHPQMLQFISFLYYAFHPHNLSVN